MSQLSEHAQSMFSSLTLEPGQGFYLMVKTLSRTHKFDRVGVRTAATHTHNTLIHKCTNSSTCFKVTHLNWGEEVAQVAALRGSMIEIDSP